MAVIDIAELKLKIAPLAEKYNLKLVVLFGSKATGRTHKNSDIDIGFLPVSNNDFNSEANLLIDLYQLFRREDVQLVNLGNASPLLQYSALSECVVLFEKDSGIYNDARNYAFKLYVEAKPLYDLRRFRLSQYVASINI